MRESEIQIGTLSEPQKKKSSEAVQVFKSFGALGVSMLLLEGAAKIAGVDFPSNWWILGAGTAGQGAAALTAEQCLRLVQRFKESRDAEHSESSRQMEGSLRR